MYHGYFCFQLIWLSVLLREEIERQRAHERYMRLQEQGKTEQARKDLGTILESAVGIVTFVTMLQQLLPLFVRYTYVLFFLTLSFEFAAFHIGINFMYSYLVGVF